MLLSKEREEEEKEALRQIAVARRARARSTRIVEPESWSTPCGRWRGPANLAGCLPVSLASLATPLSDLTARAAALPDMADSDVPPETG